MTVTVDPWSGQAQSLLRIPEKDFGDDSGKDFGDDSYSPSSWESIFLNDWKILVFFSKLSIIS